MDKITAVKSQLRLREWADRISDCQASTMTVAAWCEANGINIKTYYYLLRKIRTNALDNISGLTCSHPDKSEESPVAFRKLEVQPPESNMYAAVTIHLPQATLEVAQGTDRQTIEAVLLALRSSC